MRFDVTNNTKIVSIEGDGEDVFVNVGDSNVAYFSASEGSLTVLKHELEEAGLTLKVFQC